MPREEPVTSATFPDISTYPPIYAVRLTPRRPFFAAAITARLASYKRRRESIMTLDRFSHWIPSMGRHAADGMEEASG
jgi:hypothetical protein